MSKTSNKIKLTCLKSWYYDFEKKSKNIKFLKAKKAKQPKTVYCSNYNDLDI